MLERALTLFSSTWFKAASRAMLVISITTSRGPEVVILPLTKHEKRQTKLDRHTLISSKRRNVQTFHLFLPTRHK